MKVEVLAMVVGVLAAGCADDNAALPADRVREGASRLNSAGARDSVTVAYEPVTGAPYTVVFFPTREVAESELVTAGVAKEIAGRIYKALAYLGSMSAAIDLKREDGTVRVVAIR